MQIQPTQKTARLICADKRTVSSATLRTRPAYRRLLSFALTAAVGLPMQGFFLHPILGIYV